MALVCRNVLWRRKSFRIDYFITFVSTDVDSAFNSFNELQKLDPYRLENMDTFSNLLYVKEMRVELAHLAHRLNDIDKYRVETCCVIGKSMRKTLVLRPQLKTWFHCFEPESKQRSAVGKHSSSPSHVKAWESSVNITFTIAKESYWMIGYQQKLLSMGNIIHMYNEFLFRKTIWDKRFEHARSFFLFIKTMCQCIHVILWKTLCTTYDQQHYYAICKVHTWLYGTISCSQMLKVIYVEGNLSLAIYKLLVSQ